MRLRARHLAALLAGSLVTLLTACGQRGDLYLPTPGRTAVPAAGATTVRPAPQFAELPQARLRYQLLGSGARTLVLIHEMGTALESWDNIVDELARDHRVLRYDLRGFGQSSKIRGDIRMDDEVADLAGLLDSLQIRGPVTLVGGALGAAVALQFAAAHPQRAEAVFAISPDASVTAERRAASSAMADRLQQLGASAVAEADLQDNYPPSLQAGHPERLAQFRALQAANDAPSWAATLRMLTVTDWDAIWPRIRCPVWIVAARLYAARPVAAMQALADAIPDGRGHLEVLDTGHFMAIQSPELVSPLLRRFLSQTAH
jgi:3-oxoadipate enol-lactonase